MTHTTEAAVTIATHGETTCREAYRMHTVDGEGANTVAQNCGITDKLTQTGNRLIDAGRELSEITVLLEVREDPCTGEQGLCLESLPHFDDMPSVAGPDGLIIAHDLCEHIQATNSIGLVDDEHQALGVAWYIRGQFADLNRGRVGSAYSPEENLASDLSREYIDSLHAGEEWEPSAADDVKLSSCDHADALRSIRDFALKSIKGEISCHDEITYSKKHAKRYLRRAIRSMALGIEKAETLYGNGQRGNTLFWNIAEAVAPHCAHFEYEGQKFELRYNLATLQASCGEYYPEEELIEIDTYTIPSYAAAVLVNDDRTGTTDEEDDLIAEWLADNFEGQYDGLSFQFDDEIEFCASPDFGLAGDCQRVTVFGREW